MKKILTYTLFSCLIFTTACGDNENVNENNDKVETKDIAKDAAIESVVSTENLGDSQVLLITTHKVWKNNALVKEFRQVDTIPSVSTPTEKKDYEFYITVK